MNDTFLEFSRFLKENSKEIRSGLIMERDSPLRDIYKKAFYRHFIRYEGSPVPVTSVSSTDSSEFVRELYNSKKLILIRAYTLFGSNIHTSFIPQVQEVARDHMGCGHLHFHTPFSYRIDVRNRFCIAPFICQ